MEFGGGIEVDVGVETYDGMAASAVLVFYDSNCQQTHCALAAHADGLRVISVVDFEAIVPPGRTLLEVLERARDVLPGVMRDAHGGAMQVWPTVVGPDGLPAQLPAQMPVIRPAGAPCLLPEDQRRAVEPSPLSELQTQAAQQKAAKAQQKAAKARDSWQRYQRYLAATASASASAAAEAAVAHANAVVVAAGLAVHDRESRRGAAQVAATAARVAGSLGGENTVCFGEEEGRLAEGTARCGHYLLSLRGKWEAALCHRKQHHPPHLLLLRISLPASPDCRAF